MDEHSMYRAHWVVYHQMLREVGESHQRLGQQLIEHAELTESYVRTATILMNRITALEKRVADLETRLGDETDTLV